MPEPDAPADLSDTLDLEPVGAEPGRFTTTVPADWNILYVFGGVSMAVAARGAERALDDPSQTLRSATATFVRPVSAGPVEVQTRVLKAGRFASQVSSDLVTPEGDLALHLVATFGQAEETELS